MCFTTSALSQPTGYLGAERLFSNDYLGDGRDRWRTGGSHLSLLWGPLSQPGRPFAPGELREYRLTSQIISPSRRPDRPYVGVLSVGVHTHWRDRNIEISAGTDVFQVGPQTGLSDFQLDVHDALGMPPPRGVDAQLGNAHYVGLTAEVAWINAPHSGQMLRPFVETQVGPEQLVRFGFDMVVGPSQATALRIREPVTGTLLQSANYAEAGGSVLLGVDIARVWGSVYLPNDRGVSHERWRLRTRIGMRAQVGRNMSIYYGLTRLSPEFQGQLSGQTVGSMTLNINF